MKTCIICANALQGQQQKFCSNKCKQKGHYDSVKEQTNTYHSPTTRALKRKFRFTIPIAIVDENLANHPFSVSLLSYFFN